MITIVWAGEILAAAAFAAVILMMHAVRHSRLGTPRDASTWFLLAVAWTMSAATTWGTFSSERSVSEDYYGNLTIRFAGFALALSRYAWPMLIVISFAAIAVAMRHRSSAAPTGLLALAVWMFGVIANILNALPWFTTGLIATGAVLTAATLLPNGRGAITGVGIYGVTLGAASGIAVWIVPDNSTQPCRPGKCGPLDTLVSGVLGNENATGLALALSLPFVAMAFNGSTRYVLTFYVAAMTWVTGSRSSLIAVIVVLAILAVCNPHFSGSSMAVGRFQPFAVTMVTVGIISSALVPFLTQTASAFSLRGLAWLEARSRIAGSWLFGSGADGWAALRSDGRVTAAAAYSTHNLWLDILFTTGVIGTALTVAMALQILRHTAFWATTLPLAAVVYAGIAERTWTLTTANWLVWVLPALILLPRQPARSSAPRGTLPAVIVMTSSRNSPW